MTLSRIGYYGKIPARADFVGRRLPDAFVGRWDIWLQAALSAAELDIGRNWRRRFLSSPGWRFVLTPGACGDTGWMGVLRPSHDAVGRCFPFLLAMELPPESDAVALTDGGNPWFRSLDALAVASARPDFDLGRLDAPLPSLAVPGSRPSSMWPRMEAAAVGLWCELPAVLAVPDVLRRQRQGALAASVWWTGGAPDVAPGVALTTGLVPPVGFAAMVDGSWERSGWAIPDPPGGAETRGDVLADWDRPA